MYSKIRRLREQAGLDGDTKTTVTRLAEEGLNNVAQLNSPEVNTLASGTDVGVEGTSHAENNLDPTGQVELDSVEQESESNDSIVTGARVGGLRDDMPDELHEEKGEEEDSDYVSHHVAVHEAD
jgi:hypothetical protein